MGYSDRDDPRRKRNRILKFKYFIATLEDNQNSTPLETAKGKIAYFTEWEKFTFFAAQVGPQWEISPL